MKRFIIIIITFFSLGCGPSAEEKAQAEKDAFDKKEAGGDNGGTYQIGDVVYLKPDSTRAVILSYHKDEGMYGVDNPIWIDKKVAVYPFEIYGKKIE
jgi:hypothetical protein